MQNKDHQAFLAQSLPQKDGAQKFDSYLQGKVPELERKIIMAYYTTVMVPMYNLENGFSNKVADGAKSSDAKIIGYAMKEFRDKANAIIRGYGGTEISETEVQQKAVDIVKRAGLGEKAAFDLIAAAAAVAGFTKILTRPTQTNAASQQAAMASILTFENSIRSLFDSYEASRKKYLSDLETKQNARTASRGEGKADVADEKAKLEKERSDFDKLISTVMKGNDALFAGAVGAGVSGIGSATPAAGNRTPDRSVTEPLAGASSQRISGTPKADVEVNQPPKSGGAAALKVPKEAPKADAVAMDPEKSRSSAIAAIRESTTPEIAAKVGTAAIKAAKKPKADGTLLKTLEDSLKQGTDAIMKKAGLAAGKQA